MCWEKQIIYTDCHHSVFEDIDCTDYKTQQARKLNPYDSSFASSSSIPARNHHQLNTSVNSAKRARRNRKNRSPWMILLCPCFACPSTPSTPPPSSPPPPQAYEPSTSTSACRGRKRCMSPVGGKCPRCVQEKAVAAMQAVPPSMPTPARTRYQHGQQQQQQQGRPELRGNTGMNDTYGAPGVPGIPLCPGDQRRQKASRPGDDVRRYQDPGAPGQPRGDHDGNGTRRDDGSADGRSGGGGVAGTVLHIWRGGRSPTSPWFNKRFHDAREEEASRQQHCQGEEQGAQEAYCHKQRTPVSHDRQRHQQQRQQHRDHQQQQKRPSGPTSPLLTQPEPIPSYVRETTFHLLPAPLKIKKTKQETSEGLTRSSACASRPLQVNATHQTGEQRSSRDQQQEIHRAIVSSPEPRIAGAGCTPELPLEELMDEVEMLWRRIPNWEQQ
ncbi:hypothetical protein CFIO01_12626 [Colletotrichum fioriniae PJ7]|uniref:Uncharacterized protein n=1 Tax=Colletotrichum fioriniae PJ7 TaxID=1445577 RepID=A0A010R1I8_9PEZI|nr:hypothetical protein CFIO01_12626 [Colletotrichum fioriniae PJ7]